MNPSQPSSYQIPDILVLLREWWQQGELFFFSNTLVTQSEQLPAVSVQQQQSKLNNTCIKREGEGGGAHDSAVG
jgi:hypothetical protein